MTPPLGPPVALGPLPNGDLSAGLDGWGRVGPSMTLVGGPVIEAGDNTTVLGPAFTVPPNAQALPVVMGVPGANAVVDVRARPVEGGADIPLATVTPDRAVRAIQLPLAAVRGRAVRIVLDPVTTLGRRLYVRSMGPPQELLPGWSVTAGLPTVGRAWGRGGLVVEDSSLVATTPAFRPAAKTTAVGVSIRGAGRVRASAGGRRASASAKAGAWTTLRLPVRGGVPTRISVVATPAEGERLAVASIGLPVTRRAKPAPAARPGR